MTLPFMMLCILLGTNVAGISASAQQTCPVTVDYTGAGADYGDYIFLMPDMPGVQPLLRTRFQKAMGTSTDVVAVAMPLATLAGVCIAQDWQGLKQGLFTALAVGGANILLKYTVRELRPDNSNYQSFPSLHTSATFACAGFLQRRYGWKFGAPAYALALYTGVGRVLAKKHHWWDVAAGAAIGVAGAYIFTTPWAKKHEFALMPAADATHIGGVMTMTF